MATATRKPAKKPAAKKPAAKRPAAKRPAAKRPAGKTPIDYVQEAIGDLAKARESAAGDAGAQLDRAADRLRALASDLRVRAEDEAQEFQSSLDRASEHLRIELGRRAIHAQGSTKALTQLSSEIRKRRAELVK